MTRARRRWGARVAAMTFLLLGGPAAVLGVLDAATALDTEYRVLGIAFAFGGLAMLTAAACLAVPGLTATWGRASGLTAAGAGASIGTYLLASQVGYGHPERLVLWSLVILASGATLLLLPRAEATSAVIVRGGHATATRILRSPVPVPGGRPRVPLTRVLASAGVSVTFIWGVFQFWYSNDYVPSTVGAALALSAHMEVVGSGAGLAVAAADVTLRNATNTRVQVISSLFTVTGSAIAAPSDTTDSAFDRSAANALQAPTEALTPYSLASRYGGGDLGQVVETGRVVPDDWSFEPGEEYSGRFTMVLPRTAAGLVLHLFVDVVVAKGTHLWLADHPDYGPRQVASGDYSYVVSEWPIQRLSTIRELTRGDQAATIVVLLGEPAGEAALEHRRIPGLFVCIDTKDRLNDSYATRLADLCPGAQRQHDLATFYGILRAFTAFDMPLPAGT